MKYNYYYLKYKETERIKTNLSVRCNFQRDTIWEQSEEIKFLSDDIKFICDNDAYWRYYVDKSKQKIHIYKPLTLRHFIKSKYNSGLRLDFDYDDVSYQVNGRTICYTPENMDSKIKYAQIAVNLLNHDYDVDETGNIIIK